MSDNPAVVRRTQLLDVVRSVPSGVMYPLESSVLLTIAIKTFDAPALTKGVLAAAGGFGLLASPFVTAISRRSGRPVMHIAAFVLVLSSVGFLFALTGSLVALVVGAIVGGASVNAVVPLTTLTYERNFPVETRGKRVARGMSLRVGVSAVVGLAMGSFLKHNPTQWWVVVAAGAIAAAAQAVCLALIPSTALARVPGVANRPWPHFDLLGTDRQLRLTLGSWMLMGFGNLMLLPLRVEYLAKPQYGIEADARKIALMTVVIPSVVRLLCIPVFGVVFDRLSFFTARILVNVLFATYIGAFFTGTSDAGLIIGAVALGVGGAGGDLMWTLWVTKFAPSDRVADYMGLHTFFTGVRAVAAPILGFAIIGKLSLGVVAGISVLMMLGASAVLLPEARAERTRRSAEST